MFPGRVRTLVFDLDGTLVDSCEDIAHSLNFTLRELKMEPKAIEEVKRFVGDGMKILLARATGNSDPAFIQKAVEIFRPHYLKHCVDKTRLYPGVKEFLEQAKPEMLGLVSNKPYDMVLKTLEHFSIRQYFGSVMGAESTPNQKPHPEPVTKTLEALKASKDAAMIVGDGVADMEAGLRAGIWTCAVTYGYRSRAELEAAKPSMMIASISELKNLIRI